jgi:hypothetical protein
MFTNYLSRLAGDGGVADAPHFFKWFAAEQSGLAAVVFALAAVLVLILFIRAVVRLVKALALLAVLLLLLWYGGFVSMDWQRYKARFTTYVEEIVERHVPERRP